MNCEEGLYYSAPVPMFYSIPSFEYLMRFYLDTTNCQKRGINCTCFSKWLKKVFKMWNRILSISAKPRGDIKNIPVKKYSLDNMAKFLEQLETKSHITLFLGQVNRYYTDFVQNIGKYIIKEWISTNESNYYIDNCKFEKMSILLRKSI